MFWFSLWYGNDKVQVYKQNGGMKKLYWTKSTSFHYAYAPTTTCWPFYHFYQFQSHLYHFNILCYFLLFIRHSNKSA